MSGAPSTNASPPEGCAPVSKDSNGKSNVDGVGALITADGVNSSSKRGALHGRRSRREEASSLFGVGKPTSTLRPTDRELDKNVKVVSDGITDMKQISREQAERAQQQQQKLAEHISDSPTGYYAALPCLDELDVTNSWNKLLRMMRNEYDMSCLTSSLARELDEDVAWNPEMLLVQLTSDMLDAEELQKDGGEAYVPVDASDIGQMTGGEVTRKRGEKSAATAPSPATGGITPVAGAAREVARGSAEKSHGGAAAAPPPSSKTLHKTPAAARPAAAPISKTGNNAANSGAAPASMSSSEKRSAEGRTSGAAGGGGGNHNKSTERIGVKQHSERLFTRK